MTYKEKLIAWNSTPKYKKELDFLYHLLDVKYGQTILDFGCGLMTAINNFSARGEAFFYGYDIEQYAEREDEHLYDKELIKKYNTIYLNHSIAHIKDAVGALMFLRMNLLDGGKVVIVTPNWEWMDKGYNEDTTVIRHYDIETLSTLIVEAGYQIDQVGQFGQVRKDIHQHNRLSNERIFIVCK